MAINIQQNISKEKLNRICEGIICAVDIHRKAVGVSEFILKAMQKHFLVIIFGGIFSLSASLVKIAISDSIGEKLVSFILVFIMYFVMILNGHLATEIKDHNNHIFTTVYYVPWYLAPLRIQKTLLFLLQRGTKDYVVNFYGLIHGTLETIAMFISSSVSYFLFLYAVSQN
ncbi:odorant receptor 43a-like [Cardiocondyla obscurior]|uniref:odorant receptor 43a-like n=1 Tax=Cardiocondyla obscurior TaxID=286306 RepID=UPI00396569FC